MRSRSGGGEGHPLLPRTFSVLSLTPSSLALPKRYLDFASSEQKAAEHTAFNPNGRIPTLVDHANGDFAVWESDAILLYLVENYDKTNKLAGSTPKEKSSIIQWLFFQSSGQGAYFGQVRLLLLVLFPPFPSRLVC